MSARNLKYPHLLPDDVALWERYLADHRTIFTHFDYDVRVGLGRDPGAGVADNVRTMAIDLSLRRIDVVAHTDSDLTIIELTMSAGFRAIGQMMAYPILYRDRYHPDKPIKTLLVAAEIQTDIYEALVELKIPTRVIPVKTKRLEPS